MLDVGGNFHNGLNLSVAVTLEALECLSRNCHRLEHMGYFSIDSTSDFPASMLFLDDRSHWPALASCSSIVSRWEVCLTLQVLCAKAGFGSSALVSQMSQLPAASKEQVDDEDGNQRGES